MFILEADKVRLIRRDFELLTSGSVAVYTARFQFSPDWDGMERVAVFKSGSQIVSVLLDDSNECEIPWEVTGPEDAGKTLYAGVYGTKGGSIVLPTIWASLGVIQPGVECGSAARPPTPSIWEQELGRKQDKLTGQPGQVVGFDESGSAVPQKPPSGGEGGGTGHLEALTNSELEALLK